MKRLTPKGWAAAIAATFGLAAGAAWWQGAQVAPAAVVVTPVAPTAEAATMLERGRHFYQLKIYAVATAEAKACLQLEPGNAGCARLLGEISEKLGRAEEAATWYQRYLDLAGPAAADAEQVKLRLFELRHPK